MTYLNIHSTGGGTAVFELGGQSFRLNPTEAREASEALLAASYKTEDDMGLSGAELARIEHNDPLPRRPWLLR